jgi:hypothetical protein
MPKNINRIRENYSKDLQEEAIWAWGMGRKWEGRGEENKESFLRTMAKNKGNNWTNSLKHWEPLANNSRKFSAFKTEYNKLTKSFAETKGRTCGHDPFTRRATFWIDPWLQFGGFPAVLSIWRNNAEKEGIRIRTGKKVAGNFTVTY